jgi:hypothetical protein
MSSGRPGIGWRASEKQHCPICGGSHSCSATTDGLHFCWRVHHDILGWQYFADSRNGFGMFRSERGDGPAGQRGSTKATTNGVHTNGQPVTPPKDFGAVLRGSLAGPYELRRLAERLGVRADALARLEVGYYPETADEPEHWLLPERDAAGKVIGLTRRYANGTKRQLHGGRRGLTYAPGTPFTGPLLAVEGASDVAAGLTLGLAVVGRPSNLGGMDLLAELVGPMAAEGCEVVVLGERDRKPDGRWPGLEGAERTAQALADAWGRPVGYALPPDDAKDLRSWLVGQNLSLGNKPRLQEAGRRFLEAVRGSIIVAEPTSLCTSEQTSVRSVKGKLSVDISLSVTDCPSQSSQFARPGFVHYPPFTSSEPFGPNACRVIEAGKIAARCPLHYVPLLQAADDFQLAAALEVGCHRYRCIVCGPKRKSRWLIHIACKFHEHDGPLFHWSAPGGTGLKTVKNRLCNLGGDFISVRQDSGAVLMIATARLPGDTIVTTAAAVEELAGTLLRLAVTRQPISTSRGWALREQERRSRRYIRRGMAPKGRFPATIDKLSADGMRPAVRETNRGRRGDWCFPAGWCEARIEVYFDDLGGLR